MPVYEFHCKNCGNYFDVRASVAEKEKGLELTCEKCGSPVLEQVFGGVSFLTGQSVQNAPTSGGGCCCGGNCG